MSDERRREADAGPLGPVVERLRRERDGLRDAMRSRALIEQAKGVLMGRHGIDAHQAFERLRDTSQRANVRLAQLAAAVLAQVSPAPTAAPGAGPTHDRPSAGERRRAAGGGVPARPAERAAARARPDRSVDVPPGPPHAAPLQVQHLLAEARLAVAASHDDIVATLSETAMGWPRPDSVVLALTEPDAALRIVASRGLAPGTASQWARIPPQVEVPLTTAARSRRPVWLGDREEVRRSYPALDRIGTVGACVVLPLSSNSHTTGVIGLSWRASVDLDEGRRSYLAAAADLVGRAVTRLAVDPASDPAVGGAPDVPWLQPLLDSSLTPAALLSPIRVDGEPVDFAVVQANPAAVAAAQRWGVRLLESTLLTAAPATGARTLLPLCRDVLADGEPRQLDDLHLAGPEPGGVDHHTLRVARMGDRVLATWRVWTPGEVLYEDLLAASQAVRVAAFRWHLPTGELRCSPNLRTLLGWPPRRPLRPETVAEAIATDHWADVRRAVVATLRTGAPFAVAVPTSRNGRLLLVAAERLTDGDGHPVALRGQVQDVTEHRAVRSAPHRLAEMPGMARRGGAHWPA